MSDSHSSEKGPGKFMTAEDVTLSIALPFLWMNLISLYLGNSISSCKGRRRPSRTTPRTPLDFHILKVTKSSWPISYKIAKRREHGA